MNGDTKDRDPIARGSDRSQNEIQSGDLYRRFLEGDDDALVCLIGEYKEGLTLYLCSVVGNVLIAEEIMEDTFCRLAIKRPRFSGRSSFKTWLYTIARNLAIDRMRKEARHPSLPLDEAMAPAELCSVEEAYLREERRVAVHRAMTRISEDYRQALWLSYFEGMTNGECAKVTGRSKRQIENLLYRAKQALKNELEKEGIGYEN